MERHKREAAPEGNPTPHGELEELHRRVADVEECVLFFGLGFIHEADRRGERLPRTVLDALERMQRPRLG